MCVCVCGEQVTKVANNNIIARLVYWSRCPLLIKFTLRLKLSCWFVLNNDIIFYYTCCIMNGINFDDINNTKNIKFSPLISSGVVAACISLSDTCSPGRLHTCRSRDRSAWIQPYMHSLRIK